MSAAEAFNENNALTGRDPVRSRMKLIKGLLRRAFNGQSRFTVPEMKAEIAARLERAREMPEGHEKIMNIIRKVEADIRENRETLRASGASEEEIGPDSRALRNLSIQEHLNGRAVMYRDRADLKYCESVGTTIAAFPHKLAIG